MPKESIATAAAPTEEQIASMSEEELLKIADPSTATPSQQDPPPAPGDKPDAGDTGDKGTPAADTSGGKKGGEGGAASAAPAAGGDPPAKTADDVTTYAGKYKSPEELIAGIREISKKLSYPYDEHAERLIEAAGAAKSYKDLEAAYQKYEQEFGKRSSAAAPAATPDPAAVAKTTATPDDEKQMVEDAKTTFARRLSAHPVMAKFHELGEQIPGTREELNELATRDFTLAQEYRDALIEVKESVASEYVQMGKLKQELPVLMEKSIAEASADLKAFSDKFHLQLTGDEIKALVAEGMETGDTLVFENRLGFTIPKPHGLLRWFKAERVDTMIDRVKLNSESAGRKKYLDELETMKTKQRGSIGNSAIPSRKVETEIKKGDLSDPDFVRGLTEEQLVETMK